MNLREPYINTNTNLTNKFKVGDKVILLKKISGIIEYIFTKDNKIWYILDTNPSKVIDPVLGISLSLIIGTDNVLEPFYNTEPYGE